MPVPTPKDSMLTDIEKKKFFEKIRKKEIKETLCIQPKKILNYLNSLSEEWLELLEEKTPILLLERSAKAIVDSNNYPLADYILTKLISKKELIETFIKIISKDKEVYEYFKKRSIAINQNLLNL